MTGAPSKSLKRHEMADLSHLQERVEHLHTLWKGNASDRLRGFKTALAPLQIHFREETEGLMHFILH